MISELESATGRIIEQEFPKEVGESPHLTTAEKKKFFAIRKNHQKRLKQFLNGVAGKMQALIFIPEKDEPKPMTMNY
jgi:pyoverdine/dityrosine biosynthesis protein Dit1